MSSLSINGQGDPSVWWRENDFAKLHVWEAIEGVDPCRHHRVYTVVGMVNRGHVFYRPRHTDAPQELSHLGGRGEYSGFPENREVAGEPRS